MISSEDLAGRCGADPEFRLAARYWNGGLTFIIDGSTASVRIVDGEPHAGPVDDGPGVVTFTGEGALWDAMTASVPPRFYNDIAFAALLGLTLGGDELAYWQYYPAIARAVELLRPAITAAPSPPAPRSGSTARSVATCTSTSTAPTTASTSRKRARASPSSCSTPPAPTACSGGTCSRTSGSPTTSG